MPPTTISKTAQVLRYFAQVYGHPGVPRKRLVKLAYMADILSRQYLGTAMTELHWISDHFGPNARDLPRFADELVSAELAEQNWVCDGNNRTIHLRAAGLPVAFDFTIGEVEVLGYITENYLTMPIDEFVDQVAKNTDPYLAVEQLFADLPMHVVDGAAKRAVGFDLERIVKAEKQEEDGEFVTLAQLVDELRTPYSS